MRQNEIRFGRVQVVCGNPIIFFTKLEFHKKFALHTKIDGWMTYGLMSFSVFQSYQDDARVIHATKGCVQCNLVYG